jgi:hypothetical protein
VHTSCLKTWDCRSAIRSSEAESPQRRKRQKCKAAPRPLPMTCDSKEGLARRSGNAATAQRGRRKKGAHPLSDDLGLPKEVAVKSKAGGGWKLRTWVGVVRDCVCGRKFVVGDAQGSR